MNLPKDIDTKGHDFKWVPPAGMYDELYECTKCGEQVMESAEDTERYLQMKVNDCGECVGKVIRGSPSERKMLSSRTVYNVQRGNN